MGGLMPLGALLCASVLLAGCGNLHSIYRSDTLPEARATVITMDAKQRAILAGGLPLDADGKPRPGAIRRFCSEPSPDVFSVIAQSFGATGSLGQGADPKTIEAALSAAFGSAENGSTIPRTQTVNMLRDLMFRTCERHLNGGYDGTELQIQAIRDQRLMVSILAIEQLTGAVTPRPAVVGASGGGASDTGDTAGEGTTGEGSGTASTSLASSAPGGLDRAHAESVKEVADTVRAIVERNFSDDSEVMMFCLKVLRDKEVIAAIADPDKDDLRKMCVGYLGTTIKVAEKTALLEAEKRLLGEMATSRRARASEAEENFALFWEKQGQALAGDAAARAALADRLQTRTDPAKAECFRSASSEAGLRTCFLALTLPQQRELLF